MCFHIKSTFFICGKSEKMPFGIYVKLDAEKGRKNMRGGSQNDVKMSPPNIVNVSVGERGSQIGPNFRLVNVSVGEQGSQFYKIV